MAPRLPRITAFYLFIGNGDPIEIPVGVPDYTRRRRIREQRARQQQIQQQTRPTNPIPQVIGRPPLILEDTQNQNQDFPQANERNIDPEAQEASVFEFNPANINDESNFDQFFNSPDQNWDFDFNDDDFHFF